MEIAISDCISNTDRQKFINLFADENYVYNFAAENMGKAGCVITKFFMVSPDSADEEDIAAVQYVESHINLNYNIYDNSVFLHIVNRNIANSSYLVFSHYCNNDGWLHYIYYMQC